MIYPDNLEQKLGFNSVRASIAGSCLSSMGSELAMAMNFATDFAEVEERLRGTAEMLRCISPPMQCHWP